MDIIIAWFSRTKFSSKNIGFVLDNIDNVGRPLQPFNHGNLLPCRRHVRHWEGICVTRFSTGYRRETGILRLGYYWESRFEIQRLTSREKEEEASWPESHQEITDNREIIEDRGVRG
jgi:hypothetical protein